MRQRGREGEGGRGWEKREMDGQRDREGDSEREAQRDGRGETEICRDTETQREKQRWQSLKL